MAEPGANAARIAARLRTLETLDALLPTLSGVLDIREVFDRVSSIAQQVIPHDGVVIGELFDNNQRVRMYATQGLAEGASAIEVPVLDPKLVSEAWESRVVDDLLEQPQYADSTIARFKMRGALFVPVRIDGKMFGGVAFYSRQRARFTADDVLPAKRIADHVALALSHKRLADEKRSHDLLRARSAKSDLLDELLTTVTDNSELPIVFERISKASQKVLAHDALVLTAVLPNQTEARVYASQAPRAAAFPEIVKVPPLMRKNPDWEFDLVDDLQQRDDEKRLDAARLGYRAALRVAIRLDGEYAAGLSFLSTTPGAYSAEDVPFARRIAERITLSFSRERGKALALKADEAAARAEQLEARVRALTEQLNQRAGFHRVIGEAPNWKRVLRQATQVGSTETTVLLLGESGTGKEVVARFIHRASARSRGPFVALNCAALPEQLLEAELFGYERGAFTGAAQTKPGQLEQAAGGTLFLDEIGEMSATAQAKFLRVLQEREFQRLGGTRVIKADTRIVAATNRDLEAAIEAGDFREDLYYRLNVFAIGLPPLRERKDDVAVLSEAFLEELSDTLGRPPAGLSRDARQALAAYHWPGNVRELRNILERAAILADGGLIVADHLALRAAPSSSARQPSPSSVPPPSSPEPRREEGSDLKSVEKTMIEKALHDARFNKSVAAKALGLTRSQLYARLRRHGLE
jgi:transcriptional regulator with GAF, ATPase, and Fis domain